MFKDATSFDPGLPSDLPAGLRLINRRATDIRKSRVEAVFAEVTGRTTFVDPLTHIGPAVEKSEQNGTHDGRVVTCPLPAARTGCVYQRVIQNVDDGGRAVDLRIPVVGGAIPLVYVKRRGIGARFSNTNEVADLVPASEVLSAGEIRMIAQFAERFGLDFGELDVLRDAADGGLYIVDVNNTPVGPPNGLPRADAVRAVEVLTVAFRDAFFPVENGY